MKKSEQSLIGEMKEYLNGELFQYDDLSWCLEDPYFISAILVLYSCFHDIPKAVKQFICGGRCDPGRMIDYIADRVTAIRIRKYRPDVVELLRKEKNNP